MKTYMPKGRQCRFFLNFKGKLTCLKGIPKNQPCAKLPEKLFSKNGFFSKWLENVLTRSGPLLRAICRKYRAQIFFLNMIHYETRSR